MVLVYALKNLVNAEIYVGISKDVQTRLKQHNAGKNRYTKAFMPWTVFYTETFENYAQARTREKYFKTTTGRRFLHSILNKQG